TLVGDFAVVALAVGFARVRGAGIAVVAVRVDRAGRGIVGKLRLRLRAGGAGSQIKGHTNIVSFRLKLVVENLAEGIRGRTLRATADALGEIPNNELQPEAHDVGVTFYLTASAAGSQAQTKFTDDPPSCTMDSDCNDGIACTTDTCKPNGKCDHVKITDQCCNNGNPRSSGTACGGTPGACENQDTCDGSGICVDNGFKSSTTVCRPSAGACDPAETCTGSSAACPADAKSTAVCRASAGPCDVAESCDGVNNGCPADTFASATTVCRGSASDCDVAEN